MNADSFFAWDMQPSRFNIRPFYTGLLLNRVQIKTLHLVKSDVDGRYFSFQNKASVAGN